MHCFYLRLVVIQSLLVALIPNSMATSRRKLGLRQTEEHLFPTPSSVPGHPQTRSSPLHRFNSVRQDGPATSHTPQLHTSTTRTTQPLSPSIQRLIRTPPPPPRLSTGVLEDIQHSRALGDEILADIADIEHRLSENKRYQAQQAGNQPRQLYDVHAHRNTRQDSSTPVYPNSQYHSGDLLGNRPQPFSSQVPVHLMPSHQVKSVPVYTGREGSNIGIEDWIRDTKYLIDSTAMSAQMQFGTIVRYLGGAARKLVLNLTPHHQTPEHAFAELRSQFGDISMLGDPLADFYERFRHPNESPGIYAVELEATLRSVEERMNNNHPLPNRNKMLTQQFMRGVRDEKVTNRLAPMKPREMEFHELQIELRQIDREARVSNMFKPRIEAKVPTQSQDSHAKVTSQPIQTQQKYPKMATKPHALSPPGAKSTDRNQEGDDVIQTLLLKFQELAQKVENLTAKQTNTQTYTPYQQPMYPPQHQQGYQPHNPRTYDRQGGPRAFVCHRCGNEGHIAKGCRSQPLNFQGPRSEGKPSDARSSAQ